MKILNLNKELENLLLEIRWSPVKLADNSSLSYHAIRKILRGETGSVRIDTISEIEKATGYTAEIKDNHIKFIKPEPALNESDEVKKIIDNDPQMQEIFHILKRLRDEKGEEYIDLVEQYVELLEKQVKKEK